MRMAIPESASGANQCLFVRSTICSPPIRPSSISVTRIPPPRPVAAYVGLAGLVLEPVAITDEPADRNPGLVRQRDRPALVGGLCEQRALDLDRIEREVVERGHPARVRRPRPHAEVAEEGEGRRAVSGAPDHDRLVAGAVAAGRDDADAGQDLALAVGRTILAPVADELDLRLVVARDQPRVATKRDRPLGSLGDDRRPRKGPR